MKELRYRNNIKKKYPDEDPKGKRETASPCLKDTRGAAREGDVMHQ